MLSVDSAIVMLLRYSFFDNFANSAWSVNTSRWRIELDQIHSTEIFLILIVIMLSYLSDILHIFIASIPYNNHFISTYGFHINIRAD